MRRKLVKQLCRSPLIQPGIRAYLDAEDLLDPSAEARLEKRSPSIGAPHVDGYSLNDGLRLSAKKLKKS
jgi:hypothetical protein